MFDKKQLEAYKSIKAPDELYDKISSDAYETKKSKIYILPLVAGIAACFVIFVGAYMAFDASQLKLSVFGQELNSTVSYNPSAEASVVTARTLPSLTVPVKIEVSKATEVSVSKGVILLDGSSSASVTVDNDTELMWTIELKDGFTPCEMTLKDTKGTTTLTLTQDETDGSFIVSIN